jgi:mitochondrial fission protein ELM1
MNIYWFQDSKTGHLKQVQALLDQLKKETELSITPLIAQIKKIFHKYF